MKGMFLQCGGCGLTKSFSFDCSPEEIEKQCHETITEGWRYVPSWGDFICANCIKGGLDPLYLTFIGRKPKMRNKVNSYKELMTRIIEAQIEFRRIDAVLQHRIAKAEVIK